ncbi:MAG: hypothetical protein CM15mP74_22590 [Halieaceae bacterium]|nr:MAG: hypothetical protein CM15mP74_22590 [Halieaceae bacterium]
MLGDMGYKMRKNIPIASLKNSLPLQGRCSQPKIDRRIRATLKNDVAPVPTNATRIIAGIKRGAGRGQQSGG